MAVGMKAQRPDSLAAVDRLRELLAYNGLTLDTDEGMLAGVLDGSVSSVELAEAICLWLMIPGRSASRHRRKVATAFANALWCVAGTK